MEGFEDYQSLQQAISARLIATTRSAGQLAAEDLDFLRASDKKAGKRVDRKNGKLLDLARQLIASSTAGTPIAAPELKKPAGIQENWQAIADVLDNLLERADRCLDEYNGVITKLSKEKESKIQESLNTRKDGRGLRSHPLEKPQLLFKRVPKNDETTPFKPLLTSKPHAKTSLEESIRPRSTEDGKGEYGHPYEHEIMEVSYPASVYTQAEPTPAVDDPKAKNLTWVDTPEKVAEMVKELKKAKEIAVDLEHHDMHSYVGLVCLMQISTRQKDWIVDTLKPWREDLQVLNQVFADPKILKVFHGSTMDIIWLQRDLGLYVVGLFDTYHATVALQYPRHSLAFLLKKFDDFDAQKQYQMADWRVRPLNQDLMQYARSDTHYLLHVYDCVRNELLEHSTADENLVDYVLQRSKEEALQRFERSFYDAEFGRGACGWLGLLIKTPARFNKQQFAVFRAVHQLRDQIARRTDESVLVVMRHDTIFAVARTMPEDMPALLGVIQPVSQFMQPKLSELLGIVRKAKASGDDGPTIEEVMERPELQTQPGVSRYLKKAMKAANHSDNKSSAPALAKVIRSEREKLEEAPSIAPESTFWGSMLEHNGRLPIGCDVRLEVPLPNLENGDDVVSNGVSVIKPASSAGPKEEKLAQPKLTVRADAESKTPKAHQDSTFSIKELKKQSRKRKAEQIAAENDTGVVAEAIAADGNTAGNVRKEKEEEHQTSKKKENKKSKAERKAEKKAKEEAAKQAQADAAPFDYASAPNVIEGSASNAKTKKQKVYDPYAKALDTPKGLPRRSGGKAGKSKTFKG